MNNSKFEKYSLENRNVSEISQFCALYLRENINGTTIGIFLKTLPDICRKYTHSQEILIGFVLGILTLSTFMGNILIIVSVAVVKKLQTPSNLLIVNLATSDLLVSVIVLPLAIVFQLKGLWPFSESLCDVFILSDVLLCTCSILGLCIISIDRYLAITRPLQYASKRTTGRITIMIFSVWILAALISVPPSIGWRETFVKGECKYSDSLGYQIYATFGAFYVPLFIMLFLYGRILLLAKRIATVEFSQRSQPSSRHNSTVLSNQNITVNERKIKFEEENTKSINEIGNNNENGNKNDDYIFMKRRTFLKHQIRPSLNFYRRYKLSSEVKAIKTLGIIMGCFTICWLPFFIIQLVMPILKAIGYSHLSVQQPVIEVFLWLGYFNSFLNPIIYAKFNRDFRTPFKDIILFRCRTINQRLRSESYVEQYGTINRRRSTSDFTNSFTSRRLTKTREEMNLQLRNSRR